MLINLLPLVIVSNGGWDFRSPQSNVSVVVEQIKKSAPPRTRIYLTEPIPDTAKADLKIKTDRIDVLMHGLASQTPIRFVHRGTKPDTWFVTWSGGPVSPGKVRLYEEGGSFVLEANTVDMKVVADTITRELGIDATGALRLAGIDGDSISSLKVGARSPGLEPDETPLQFVYRFVDAYRKSVADSQVPVAAKPATLPPKRAFWNLTFLPGSPPNPDSSTGSTFSDSTSPNKSASDIAAALTIAYANSGDAAAKPSLVVTPIGNSTLSINGTSDAVDEVRRLLATQIDVPQSQIRLQLDTYQVSADARGGGSADLVLKKIAIAQQIARAYKLAHYQAIKDLIFGSSREITETLKDRNQYGIDITDLFNRSGIDANANRILSQTDVLMFLAYSDSGTLLEEYPRQVKRRFDEVFDSVQHGMLGKISQTTSDSEKALIQELSAFNDLLHKQAANLEGSRNDSYASSRFLSAFARSGKEGRMEDTNTRAAIEEFLILWNATSDKDLFTDLKEASLKTKADRSGKLAMSESVNLYASALEKHGIRPNASRPVTVSGLAELFRLLDGDRTAKLVRASSRLDDLLATAVNAIEDDAETLVDRPLASWIDSSIVQKPGDSRFGVQFGGTTTLAVTSRVPGVTGSEGDSFFPYQPPSPISLDSLVPLLSRHPKTPGTTSTTKKITETSEDPTKSTTTTTTTTTDSTEATDTSANLLAGGATPIETAALKAIFDQASKPSFDRVLSSGVHFSVLPTMLPNGSTARLQIKLSISVTPGSGDNTPGTRGADKPGPVNLLKSSVVQTELLANAFDITSVSSLKLNVTAPSKRDWEVPILSQILPIRSWFVGPTQDKTVRHEAIVLIRVTIIPRAMDLASRSLDGG